MARRSVGAQVLLAGLLAAGLPGASLQAQEETGETAALVAAAGGACDRTTRALAVACGQSARADHAEALGACANTRAAADRERCLAAAERELASAQGECREQAQARERVCRALGQAPYDPEIRPADFVRGVTNPYFPLRPGTVFVYRGEDSVTTVTVTGRTVRILGVTCTVVRDTVVVDGELEEDTLDFYAQDRQGNVWYFGEATAEFADGFPVSTDGSWLAGRDGAKPGIIMPAAPRPGFTYRQEFAPGEAEDLGRVEGLGQPVRVPYGRFQGTLKTFDFTPLEPDARESKHYAPGVGLVLTVNLETGEREELVSVRHLR